MLTTDIVTGIMDSLGGGLEMMGLDVDGLLASMGDNEIINFFANMYIGFIGEVEESTTAPTTTAPAPQKTPNTGDTASAAVAAVALCVAVAAAGVCLKKKED